MVGNVATAAVKGLHVAAALASGRFILRSYEILAIYAPFNPIFLLLQQKESVWKVCGKCVLAAKSYVSREAVTDYDGQQSDCGGGNGIDDDAGEGEAEGGSGKDYRTVGTLGAVDGDFALGEADVGHLLRRVGAAEFALGKDAAAAKALSQSTGQRVALYFPKFGNAYLREVCLAGGTHARDETGRRCRGIAYQQGFVCNRVDGIDHPVICFEVEISSSVGSVYAMHRPDIDIGIYGTQALGGNIHFGTSYGLGGGYELAIDVAGRHNIAVHKCYMAYATACQCFGAPRPYASYTEDDDTKATEPLEGRLAQEQLGAIEVLRCVCVHLTSTRRLKSSTTTMYRPLARSRALSPAFSVPLKYVMPSMPYTCTSACSLRLTTS